MDTIFLVKKIESSKFTEDQILGCIESLRDEFPEDIITRDLAILELEDMKRKGCTLVRTDGNCGNCLDCTPGHNSRTNVCHKCIMNDWTKLHPEYIGDKLTQMIRIMERGNSTFLCFNMTIK